MPWTISGAWTNGTSFTLKDRVLAEGMTGPPCTDLPLLLTKNGYDIPVNASDNFSQQAGNVTWHVAATNPGRQEVSLAYATLLLRYPSSNGSGYDGFSAYLGSIPVGQGASATETIDANLDSGGQTTFHVELSNGTSVDFVAQANMSTQTWYKAFVMADPGSGILAVQYVLPNLTSSVNVTKQIVVTNLSASGAQGVSVTATPSVISSSPGPLVSTPVDLDITASTAASPGVYLVSYTVNACPRIILVVGPQPSSLPNLPISSWSDCFSPHVTIVSGMTVTWLP